MAASVILPLLLVLTSIRKGNGFNGVAGSIHTISGYDTEYGNDPICWVTAGASISDATTPKMHIESDLEDDFYVTSDAVKTLPECPGGISLKGYAPDRTMQLVTGQTHDYKVAGSINMTALSGESLVSNKFQNTTLQVEIVLCDTTVVGFCTPFTNEHVAWRMKMFGLRGGIAGGSMPVLVRRHFIDMDFSDGDLVKEFELVIPLVLQQSGNFFAIAAVQFFSGSAENKTVAKYKYDIATSLDTRFLVYHDPPTIMTVTPGVNAIVITVIALASAAQTALLAFAVINRKSKVMRLTQGNFLILCLFLAVLATVCSIFFNPKNDLYCNATGPLVFIPLHLTFSVTLGRLWRINAVISPILKTSQEGKMSGHFFGFLTWVSKLSLKTLPAHIRACWQKDSSGNSLHVAVSAAELRKVVAFFATPMIIVQILCLTLEPMTLSVMFTDDMSTGKTYCKALDRINGSLEGISLSVFFATFLLMLVMAYDTRNLPSLLSETKTIYNVAFTAVMVVGLGLIILLLTDSPTTSPNVKYVLSVVMVVSVALSMSFGIMVPKFKVILDGDDVRVNKLVSDHRESLRVKAMMPSRSSRFFGAVRKRSSSAKFFGNSDSPRYGANKNNNGSALEKPAQEQAADLAPTNVKNHSTSDEKPQGRHPTMSEDSASREADKRGGDTDSLSRCRARHENRRVQFLADIKRGMQSERMTVPTREDLAIFVEEDESPPRRLFLRMVKAQEVLANVNNRIVEGCAITKKEWEDVKSCSQDLGDTFYEDVQFWWEIDEEVAREIHNRKGSDSVGELNASQGPELGLPDASDGRLGSDSDKDTAQREEK